MLQGLGGRRGSAVASAAASACPRGGLLCLKFAAATQHTLPQVACSDPTAHPTNPPEREPQHSDVNCFHCRCRTRRPWLQLAEPALMDQDGDEEQGVQTLHWRPVLNSAGTKTWIGHDERA